MHTHTLNTHHHPQRPLHNTWAHVQQRLRRNCLIGPVAFCLLALLGMPYVLEQTDLRSMPFVEAVPFFRRAKAIAFRRGLYQDIPAGGAAVDKDSSSTTTAETPTASSTVGLTEPPAEEQAATTEEAAKEEEEVPELVEALAEATATATDSNKDKKRKHSDISSSSAYNYNFPLVPSPEEFKTDANAAVPFRYFEAHQHNDEIARKAVVTSLEWRQEHQIDTILNRPQVNYDVAKRILPHYFVGRSAVTDHVVFVQRPGLADLPLADHNNILLEEMLHQYAFVFEYCWNILHANQQQSMENDKDLMIGIMDLQGLNLSVLRKPQLINFVKEFVAMIDAHYPTRAYKTYMVNAPGWFSTLYKLISPIMRETTKEKIVIHSAGKEQNEALEDALGKDMAELLQSALRIPDKKERKQKAKNDLTLTSDNLLETEMEQQIRNFVLGRLEEEGLEMKTIVPMN